MKKTTLLLFLGLAVMLVVAGCAAESTQDDRYAYIPSAAGAGCGFADEPVNNAFLEATTNDRNAGFTYA